MLLFGWLSGPIFIFLICISIFPLQGQYLQLSSSDKIHNCEDVSVTIQRAKVLTPPKIFLILSEPLSYLEFDNQAYVIKNKIYNAIMGGYLNVQPIFANLHIYKSSNRYDLLISILLRMGSTNSFLRNDINILVMYLIMNKYLPPNYNRRLSVNYMTQNYNEMCLNFLDGMYPMDDWNNPNLPRQTIPYNTVYNKDIISGYGNVNNALNNFLTLSQLSSDEQTILPSLYPLIKPQSLNNPNLYATPTQKQGPLYSDTNDNQNMGITIIPSDLSSPNGSPFGPSIYPIGGGPLYPVLPDTTSSQGEPLYTSDILRPSLSGSIYPTGETIISPNGMVSPTGAPLYPKVNMIPSISSTLYPSGGPFYPTINTESLISGSAYSTGGSIYPLSDTGSPMSSSLYPTGRSLYPFDDTLSSMYPVNRPKYQENYIGPSTDDLLYPKSYSITPTGTQLNPNYYSTMDTDSFMSSSYYFPGKLPYTSRNPSYSGSLYPTNEAIYPADDIRSLISSSRYPNGQVIYSSLDTGSSLYPSGESIYPSADTDSALHLSSNTKSSIKSGFSSSSYGTPLGRSIYPTSGTGSPISNDVYPMRGSLYPFSDRMSPLNSLVYPSGINSRPLTPYGNSDMLKSELFTNRLKYTGSDSMYPSMTDRLYSDSNYPRVNPLITNNMNNPCSGTCGCQNNMLHILLEKLLKRNNPSMLLPSDADLQNKIVDILNKLRNMLPVPKYPMEEKYYYLIKRFLDSPNAMNLLSQNNLYENNDLDYVLNELLQEALSTSKNLNLINAIRFYLKYDSDNENNNIYGNIVDLLPKPTTPMEHTYYNTLKRLLLSKEINLYMNNLQLTGNENLNDVYLMILRNLLNNSMIPSHIDRAVRYYYEKYSNSRPDIQLDSLINILPISNDQNESQYYTNLVNFLQSTNAYNYFMMKKIPIVSNQRQQLILLLQSLLKDNELPVTLKQSAKYFLYTLLGIRPDIFKTVLIPTNQEDLSMLNGLENYALSSEFSNILMDMNLPSDMPVEDQIQLILDKMKSTTTNSDVLNYINYIMRRLGLRSTINRIILLLPKPKTDEQQQRYVVVKNYLNNYQNLYPLVRDIDFSLFNDDKFLMELILKKISESQVDAKISNAFKDYLELTEELASLDLITKKEIKRHFKLTEIFIDTLDLNRLTMNQRDAFKIFFKFISEIKPDAIRNFDSWDQATTRGEFMKLLFEYFLKSDDVPYEIKANIAVLQPLIKMVGRGALPP